MNTGPTPFSPHVPIPTRDGTVLSAAVHWPPGDKAKASWPALVEYHPYRKDDRSSARAADHEYFAKNGFVSVRLDVRGTGSSQGINTDEYMAVETQDGHDAVEWLASQPWSNGRVGMFGSSYGGFTCYQVAVLQPPSLKAIVPIYATDDRYTDDCHYKGGSLKAYYDTGTYGTMMVALNGLPPDPELYGDDWEGEWERRLAGNRPYMLQWLDHPRDDSGYWRQGSLRGRYDRLQAATFIIGGWQAGYPNPPMRTFHNIGCPKKLLIGPWNHSRPDVAVPGPRIDYLNEMRRWFELHLKGEDDGIGAESPVTYFVQQHDPPDPARKETSGGWRSETSWPPELASVQTYHLATSDSTGHNRLLSSPVKSPGRATLETDPTVGIQGGLWSGGLPFGLPGDQRPDEARSLTFTSTPFVEPLIIAGNPSLVLTVSSSTPTALFVAKLSDVAPDGSSALICRGLLNGSRRDGHVSPEPMEPEKRYRLQIELDATAWQLASGHRLRLSISGSDFPNSWPSPERTVISIYSGGGSDAVLSVPLVSGEGVAGPEFLPAPFQGTSTTDAGDQEWSIIDRPLENLVTLRIHRGATSQARKGVEFTGSDDLTLTTSRISPAETTATGRSISRVKYPGTEFESVATQVIRSDAFHFHWSVDLRVTQDGVERHRRKWQKSFPRDLM